LSFSVCDWWVRNSTISASNVRFCIESVGTGNTGVFILKAKTKEEKVYHLLSDVEDESNITPSDEKLSLNQYNY
jgi:hypothetical protein